MATTASGTSQFPLWAMITAVAYFTYRLLSSARTEESRRREQNQPHTRRDTVLLLVTALPVVGVLVCAMFLKPLNLLVNSRAGIVAVILVVGGGLTYFFNRSRAPHPKWLVIGVGIAIARDPLHGPGRALISASGSYRR